RWRKGTNVAKRPIRQHRRRRTVMRMTKASNSGNVYLVEHYSPGLTVDGLGSWAARVRDTAVAMRSEGRAVRYLRSTIVPADEALLCVFEADSEELVREVYARA